MDQRNLSHDRTLPAVILLGVILASGLTLAISHGIWGRVPASTWSARFPRRAAPSGPIYIGDNTALATHPAVTGGPGDTYATAYILEDLEVTPGGNNGIHIRNVDKYLVIRNCSSSGATGGASGIYIEDCQHVFVDNCTTTTNGYAGVHIDGGEFCSVTTTTTTGNGYYGIYLYYTNNNSITWNNASDNARCGIRLYQASENNLTNNEALINTQYGMEIRSYSDQNGVSGNNLSGNEVYGMRLYYRSDENLIYQNNISDNDNAGIYVDNYCGKNAIQANEISWTRAGPGIVLDDDNYQNEIRENHVTRNAQHGVFLDYFCDENLITANNLAGNTQHGLALTQYCDNNEIEHNLLNENGGHGAFLDDSDNNKLKNNTAWDNAQYGLRVESGADLNELWDNFVGANDVDQGYDADTSNAWDDGVGRGNYWGDYQTKYPGATHAGGVWNTDYELAGPTNQLDHFPLVFPNISTPADVVMPLGWPGNAISWNVTGPEAHANYTLLVNDLVNRTGAWSPWTPVVVALDAPVLSPGTYNYTLVAQSGGLAPLRDTVWVTVNPNQAPGVTRPVDLSYAVGTTGNSLSWTATDVWAPAPTYSVARNGTVVATGAWASGGPITVPVDGLAVGDHEFVITISDGTLVAQDTVLVHVLTNQAPTVTHPADLYFRAGTTGNVLTWTVSDPSVGPGAQYLVRRDGIQAGAGT